ncbi:MAG: hypothetical protein ACJZ6A_04270 [Candidatus Poseidoniaceae archaeon]
MKTDRIFVLLLVVMLPMSGCFGDAVGDAEGAEDNSGTTVIHYNNTTVINHHYHNNTTTNTNVIQNSPVVMSIHGPNTFLNNVAPPGVLVSTTPGQVLEVLQIWQNTTTFVPSDGGPGYVYAYEDIIVEVTCDSLSHSVYELGHHMHDRSMYLPTDGGDCTYWFYTIDVANNNEIWINVIYQIHN